MDTSQHSKYSLHGNAVKEEENPLSTFDQVDNGEQQGLLDETVLRVGSAGKKVKDEDGIKPQSPNQENLTSTKQMNQLQSVKAEMEEVMEENHRLRTRLDHMLKDYRALEDQCKDVVARKEARKSVDHETDHQSMSHENDQKEEAELISLCLGRNSTKNGACKRRMTSEGNDGLKLGLDCKYEASSHHEVVCSPENSLEEEGKEMAGETSSSPRKNVENTCGEDDQILLQNAAKRARVSVRYRCDTPTMNDGCQWRKYGQKISKGNPCPRAYYRCTVAPSCPVRKQVQRCVEDMSILVTTYEGTHNHPLPVSATAMASTTSAAVSMITSGSSATSGLGLTIPSTSTATSSNLNGLNFYLSSNAISKPFYIPNSSTLSSPSHPTITLDLVSNPTTHLNRQAASIPPRFPYTNLNFSSSFESNSTLPNSWTNGGGGGGGGVSYGTPQLNKINQNPSSLSFGAQSSETLYQSCMQKYLRSPNQQSQQAPERTIAAATKAITSDPNFQSAVAAALASILGSGYSGASSVGSENGSEKSSQKVNASEPFPVLSSFVPSPAKASKCTTSTVAEKSSPSASSQPESLRLLPPSFPFSSSKSKPTSPGGHERDHIG